MATTSDNRHSALQALCRKYLGELRPLAEKFGLAHFVDTTISLNAQDRCKGTEEEVELLARACDDERISRVEVPKLLGKSYRQSFEDDDFDKVKRLRHVGIFSKVSTILLKSELDKEKEQEHSNYDK